MKMSKQFVGYVAAVLCGLFCSRIDAVQAQTVVAAPGPDRLHRCERKADPVPRQDQHYGRRRFDHHSEARAVRR